MDYFRSGYWQTAALSAAAVTAAFNPCTPATLPCHARQVADMVIGWTETAAELGAFLLLRATRGGEGRGDSD